MRCIICSMSISLGGGNIPIRIGDIIVEIAIETTVSVIVGVTTKRTANPFNAGVRKTRGFPLPVFNRQFPFHRSASLAQPQRFKERAAETAQSAPETPVRRLQEKPQVAPRPERPPSSK